jgi:hypothetical protein
MYMLRFFIASRLASGRDLYFEIACNNAQVQPLRGNLGCNPSGDDSLRRFKILSFK